MGNDGPDANPGDDEGPVRDVALPAFRIAATAVTLGTAFRRSVSR